MSSQVVAVYYLTIQIGSDVFGKIGKLLCCHGEGNIHEFICVTPALKPEALEYRERRRLGKNGNRKDTGFPNQVAGQVLLVDGYDDLFGIVCYLSDCVDDTAVHFFIMLCGYHIETVG